MVIDVLVEHNQVIICFVVFTFFFYVFEFDIISADIDSIAAATRTITKTNRTSSPGTSNHRVEFFIDTQSNSKRSASPGLSLIDNINENSDKEKVN